MVHAEGTICSPLYTLLGSVLLKYFAIEDVWIVYSEVFTL